MKEKNKKLLKKIGITTVSKILQILQGGAEASLLIFDALTSSKREGYRKLHNYEAGQYTGDNWGEIYKEKQKLWSTLNRLKRDGLIEKNKDLWKITKNGLMKLEKIEPNEIKRNILEKSKPSNNLIIISYDIPERYKKERWWVIEILKILDFKMIHYSFWVGKIKVPQEFLEELKIRGILDCFHIFEVNKTGTLKTLN
jgi:hypothetical protein